MIPWTPEYIDTALWLDAADSSTITESGGAVSAWADKSGNGRDAIQATPAYRPIYDETQPSVYFNVNNLSHSFQAPESNICVFLVGTSTSNTLWRCAAIFGVNLNIYAAYSSPNWGHYNSGESMYSIYNNRGIIYIARTSNNVIYRSNGSAETLNPRTTYSSSSVIGAVSTINGESYKGHINEIIALQIQSDESRRNIEGYLAHKWGLTANLPADHPYKTAAPQAFSISGTITGADGNPAARTVRAYSRSTGALLQETTSDATAGAYDLGFTTNDEVQRVVIADETALYNDIIDRVIPG